MASITKMWQQYKKWILVALALMAILLFYRLWYQDFAVWIADEYGNWVQQIPTGKRFSPRAIFDAVPDILGKLPTTVGLTLVGAFFGLVLGLVFAIVKIKRVPVLYQIQSVAVSFLRGTPILVQLLLSYYGIPMLLREINAVYGLELNVDNVPAAVFVITAFAFNEAAYASETIRAAIQSVNAGEIEAARSLGMTEIQVYRRVIIPNAAVIAMPTLINSLIGLTKGTSLAYNAGITEIFNQAKISSGNDYRYFERYVAVSLIYWSLSILIERFGRRVENNLAIKTPELQPLPVGGDR